MNQLEPYLTPTNLLLLAAVLGVLSIFTLILLIVTLTRLGRTRRRYEALMRGPNGADLETILLSQANRLSENHERIAALERLATDLRAQLRGCTQRVGIVRFNAFPEVGADLSFAIALLDEDNNGVVISGLYGREDSRVYAKPVVAGESTYLLTGEEREAIRRATSRNSGKPSAS